MRRQQLESRQLDELLVQNEGIRWKLDIDERRVNDKLHSSKHANDLGKSTFLEQISGLICSDSGDR